MGRLIDVDEALSYIARIENSGLGKNKSLEYISKYIENQPTAYDPNKVVEQLEKLKKYSETKDCPKDGMCDGGDCENCYMNTAIEIVKAGYISTEKPTVYGEWIPAPDIGDCCYRCSECGKIIDHYCDEDDNYCSRCGKNMRKREIK